MDRLLHAFGYVLSTIHVLRHRRQYREFIRTKARCRTCTPHDTCVEHAYQRDLIRYGLYDDYRAWLASDD
jgi:hypothetical protein